MKTKAFVLEGTVTKTKRQTLRTLYEKFSLSKLALTGGLFTLVACQNSIPTENRITNPHPGTYKKIETPKGDQFVVIGPEALAESLRSRDIVPMSSPEARELLDGLSSGSLADDETIAIRTTPINDETLLFGFPSTLVDQDHVFGGVITGVSDKHSMTLGMLKLSDLPPIHVKPRIIKQGTDVFGFALVGCPANCTKDSAGVALIQIPILGIKKETKQVILDLAALGEGLNLVSLSDPTGASSQLKTRSSSVVAFDYTQETLVFDVLAKMVPVGADDEDAAAPVREFNTRWYLRSVALENPNFDSRPNVEGVGFFTTQRAQSAKLVRHQVPKSANEPKIKYYVKNVPDEYKAGFKAGLDDWNRLFKTTLGFEAIEFEFLDEGDADFDKVLTGDVRYNVIEWDSHNVAPYNALGPFIAHQLTGQILSSNVLVQGDSMVASYKEWFESVQGAIANRREGRSNEADAILAEANHQIRLNTKTKIPELELRLNKHLRFQIPAQIDGFKDTMDVPSDSHLINERQAFNQFMNGVFRATVSHEVGHNMGLRHNFRGSLGGKADPGESVSSSIMDYLSRALRHRDRLSEYDTMAIEYGYQGKAPPRKDMFCTDSEVSDFEKDDRSAECSKDDATNDPFGHFLGQLQFAKNLLLAPDSEEAPLVTVEKVAEELVTSIQGMALYAISAKKTSGKWTHFYHNGNDRPREPEAIKSYVKDIFQKELCEIDPYRAALQAKTTPEAREATLKNAQTYLNVTAGLLIENKVWTLDELKCPEAEADAEAEEEVSN